MAINFKQHGEALHYVVQASDNIKSGDLVAVGSVVGVAITDGVEGEPLAVSVTGVYDVPVPAAVGEITQGTPVYFDPASKEITLDADNGATPPVANVLAGYAWDDGEPGDWVPIRLIF